MAAMKTKKGHPGDEFGSKLSSDPDMTNEQKTAAARQRELAPIVSANYLASIGGKPANFLDVGGGASNSPDR